MVLFHQGLRTELIIYTKKRTPPKICSNELEMFQLDIEEQFSHSVFIDPSENYI